MTDHSPGSAPCGRHPDHHPAPTTASPLAASSATVAPDVLRARAFLMRVCEPRSTAAADVVRMVAEHGPVETAERVRAGALPDGLGDQLLLRRVHDQADADVDAARRVGGWLLVPEDPDWPTESLRTFGSGAAARLTGPLGLWVRGRGAGRALGPAAMSVIGSRTATGYGLHLAGEIGSALAGAGITVVSGAAFGVDAAAHHGALVAGGPTVAVLACGIDRAYPVAHTSLLDRIAGRGLVVSEYPPGTVPARHRFLARNRIVVALGRQGCVVAEARVRSGSRAAAADAAALGRHVMAVPGPVTSATSAGCHALIRAGAELLASPQQLLDRVDGSGCGVPPRRTP